MLKLSETCQCVLNLLQDENPSVLMFPHMGTSDERMEIWGIFDALIYHTSILGVQLCECTFALVHYTKTADSAFQLWQRMTSADFTAEVQNLHNVEPTARP